MAPSLKLIHRTANRWRYRLNDVLEINWERLRLDLSEKFPEGPWTVRLNPVASTLIIIQNERRLGQCSDPTYIVRASLSQQLAKQGIVVSEIPLSKTVVVQSRYSKVGLGVRRIFRLFANAVSISLSLSALLTALALLIIGVFGLLLPLSPGFWILMLATVLFDFAMTLRQPFTQNV